jgi:hypothetical protein
MVRPLPPEGAGPKLVVLGAVGRGAVPRPGSDATTMRVPR